MYVAIGKETNKTYAKSNTKSGLFMTLLEKYPSTVESDHFVNQGVQVTRVYPEPLLIKRSR